jgi:hypothetical protein
MKTSKHGILRLRSLVFMAAVLAIVAGRVRGSEPLPPDNTTGSGSTVAINDYQFQGSAALTIHGQEKSADLLVTVLEPPVVDPDGVHHVVATHTFTFADGSSITTSDQETAEPTATPGLYALTAEMDVVSGTGLYEGVSGILAASGTMDFAAQPPAAEFELAGVILEDTRGSGSTVAINDYQFQGTAALTIHGQEKSADLLVTVLEPPVVDPDGVHHVVATHTFTFADGSSITTSDQETAEPTATPGLYALTAEMDVVSGTGLYEGVSGVLAAYGTMDFAAQPPAAEFELVGFISALPAFIRGDASADGEVDLGDALRILRYLFVGRGDSVVACQKTADVNDDGEVEIADAIHLLCYLFSGRTEITSPFPACGVDSTPDELTCDYFPPCM